MAGSEALRRPSLRACDCKFFDNRMRSTRPATLAGHVPGPPTAPAPAIRRVVAEGRKPSGRRLQHAVAAGEKSSRRGVNTQRVTRVSAIGRHRTACAVPLQTGIEADGRKPSGLWFRGGGWPRLDGTLHVKCRTSNVNSAPVAACFHSSPFERTGWTVRGENSYIEVSLPGGT